MKKALIFLFLSSVFSSGFAQDSDSDVISRHRPGIIWYYVGIAKPKKDDIRKYDRVIFDIVYNDWTGKSTKPFKVSPASIGFNTNFMFDIPLTHGNTVSFGWGLSYGLYRIRMNDFFVRDEVNKASILTPDIKQFGIDRSGFTVNSLSLPLELRFRGRNWKHVKFQLGGKISWQFHATTSLFSSENNILHEQKTVGFYDLNPINASAHVRFGIRNWGLYASYNFLPFFKSAQSTQLNGLQFGLSISLF